MSRATWVLLLSARASPAGATSTPDVLLARKTLDEPAHKIRIGVDDRGGEKVFWYAGGHGKDPQTAWSKPITRKDVAKK